MTPTVVTAYGGYPLRSTRFDTALDTAQQVMDIIDLPCTAANAITLARIVYLILDVLHTSETNLTHNSSNADQLTGGDNEIPSLRAASQCVLPSLWYGGG